MTKIYNCLCIIIFIFVSNFIDAACWHFILLVSLERLYRSLLANVSTYNLLLMVLDDSECAYKWDRAMELVKCMAQEPVVHPNKSLNPNLFISIG